MSARALLRRAYQEWPRLAQVGGIVLGLWQIVEWKIAGTEPNVGVMGFAGSLVLLERAAAGHRKRNGD